MGDNMVLRADVNRKPWIVKSFLIKAPEQDREKYRKFL
jgi:hypothetical protein